MTLLISHIPKTAGTSLRTLVGHLSPDTAWAYNRELSLLAPNLEFISNFRNRPKPPVLMGHFSYGAHRLLSIQPAYITVLRHPIDRVVSLYRYQRRLPNSDFLDYFQRGLTLHDYVSSGITEMTNNHACRVIAGVAPDAGMIINTRWLLELAIHNLQRHYRLVGVLENMDYFLTSLAKLLEWQCTDFPRDNVTTGLPIILDDRTRSCIINHNQLDIELYNYVLEQHQRPVLGQYK